MLLASENALARTRPHLRAETRRGLGDRGAGRFFPLRDRHGRPMACEYPPHGNSDAEILEAPRRAARPRLGGSEWRNRLSATCTQPVVFLGAGPLPTVSDSTTPRPRGRRWQPAYLAHTEATRASRSWSSRPSRC